jgi:hypothetical protein
MSKPELSEAHQEWLYSRPEQFRAAAVSNYFIWERENYDYTVSPINEYYRAVLEMARKGWPGGMRWLHGEERA